MENGRLVLKPPNAVCAESRLEELLESAGGLAEARRVFCAEQAAFDEALASFAPGLGAGNFLGAAFSCRWKALAAQRPVETSPACNQP